jgi:hypothetical protein
MGRGTARPETSQRPKASFRGAPPVRVPCTPLPPYEGARDGLGRVTGTDGWQGRWGQWKGRATGWGTSGPRPRAARAATAAVEQNNQQIVALAQHAPHVGNVAGGSVGRRRARAEATSCILPCVGVWGGAQDSTVLPTCAIMIK